MIKIPIQMGSIDLNWKKFLEKGDEASFEAIYITYVDDLFAYGMGLGYQRNVQGCHTGYVYETLFM